MEGSGSGNANYFVIESDKNVNDGEFVKALYIGMEDLNAHFGANVFATKFIGDLEGTAKKATQDSEGQQINKTYMKGLSISGKTITYTKGDGTTGTITLPNDLNRSTAVNANDTNYTTLMARGESLNGSDTTPAVNGAIAWTFK